MAIPDLSKLMLLHQQNPTIKQYLGSWYKILEQFFSVMTSVEGDSVSKPSQEKQEWVTPHIALMLAQKTSAKFSNPREGGNSTEGFMGPS